MHFDPVSSQEPPSARSSSIESAQIIDHEIESEDESPLRRAREGLPPAFRMRHQRHYVEQLLGDAPLRTVRDIAVDDIESPPGEAVEVLITSSPGSTACALRGTPACPACPASSTTWTRRCVTTCAKPLRSARSLRPPPQDRRRPLASSPCLRRSRK